LLLDSRLFKFMNNIHGANDEHSARFRHEITLRCLAELRVVSGGASFVAVMQSTDLTHRDDWPYFWRLNCSWLG